MASLVADYSSDSESSVDSRSPGINTDNVESLSLPKPDFKVNSSDGHSVFINPFIEADNAKVAILEKHVKMISTDVKTVNGKKICWNYRKNKCRFGHKCKYAHDSDLQSDLSKDKPEPNRQDRTVRVLINDPNKEPKSISTPRKRPNCNAILVPDQKIMKTTKSTKLHKNNI